MTEENNIKKEIEQRVMGGLGPDILIVNDVSYKHAGHNESAKKGGTHFEITIVAGGFEGVNRIKRHRIIYKILEDMMDNPIHAIQLQTHTRDEYHKLAK